MIRFLPDTWTDALLRPLAMVSPDSNVYVEISAPDLRFAAVALLAAALLLWRRRLLISCRPVFILLIALVLSMVVWLLTSGNGRYYVPMLLAVGPLVVGLVTLLPATRAFRVLLAAGLLLAQGYVLVLNPPWDSWTWVYWNKAPYFQVDLPPADPQSPPPTYVTLSSISYSLIAPQFPPSTRWISLASVAALPEDEERVHRFLAAARKLVLVAPTIHGQVNAEGAPTQEVRQAMNALLASRKVALDPKASCRLLRSRGVAGMGRRDVEALPAAALNEAGFWLCPLNYPVEAIVHQRGMPSPRAEAAFERVERMCPRFFPPNESATTPIAGGDVRHYPSSDMKLYVLDDGTVLYKFWRALNPMVIGTVDGVLAGTDKLDCGQLRGRAGLPWDREI